MSGHRLKAFALATGERAAKTFAQTLAAVIVTDQVTSLVEADWQAYLSAAGLAALLSVLSSIASAKAGNAGPSLANETVTPVGPAGPTGDEDLPPGNWLR